MSAEEDIPQLVDAEVPTAEESDEVSAVLWATALCRQASEAMLRRELLSIISSTVPSVSSECPHMYMLCPVLMLTCSSSPVSEPLTLGEEILQTPLLAA